MARTKKPVHVAVPEGLRPLLVPIDSITPDSRDPKTTKKRGFTGLKRSLKDIGIHVPVVCNQATRKVVVFRRLYLAMLELGQTEIPAVFVEEDDAASIKRAFLDKRAGEVVSGWDFDMVDILLEEIDLELDLYNMEWPEEKPSDGRTVHIIEVEVRNEDAQQGLIMELEGRGFDCQAKTKKAK